MRTALVDKLRAMAIRQKIMLIVIVTASTALLLTGLAIVVADSILYRNFIEWDLTTFAQIVAYNSAAPLAFDDERSATETLAALRPKTHIVAACLYRKDGSMLARYLRFGGGHACPPPGAKEGIQSSGAHLTITRAVTLNGRRTGTIVLLYDMEELGDRIRLYSLVVLIVISFSSILAFLLSSRLSAILAMPILQLARTAGSVSQTRDYSIRATRHSQDEIGLLADSFNEMLQRIQKRDSELTEALAAEREALRRLAQLNADLRRSNEDLERFAFVASHDLQEPLRNIAISSQLLIRLYPNEFTADGKVLVDRIVDGTKRMSELLTDLRSYMEVASSRKTEAEKVDLNVALECAIENLRASIEETNTAVTADPLPNATAAYQSDFVALFQNLIGNAIKYRSQEPPRIHVSAAQESNGTFRIAVKDNGIGIAPAYHSRIFKPFVRLHGREIPGTGIGLAICQRVVERYRGRIWVESQVGSGAIFHFTISGGQPGALSESSA